ncbi:BMP-binding endothelial regulator protein-like [Anthonomus grandis grandis]|uniref:BMP-binding endothelial regulator protein-like n=1 Tax=Anthonomus grandis grandis TaxID=2921223 RepID=UPI0021653CD0|nr:BMP-binding endothelial regulator protein-like [Anthonomus grandis grandis]
MNTGNIQWTLIISIISLGMAYGSGMAPLPAGKRQQCANEGEPVTTGFDAQIVDCYPCICKNGYVECKNNCPRIDECHLVVQDRCCKICKGCIYKGLSYPSHTEWTDPNEPCKILRCEAGVVTISDLHCYTPCKNSIPPEPGKCCRTCPDCQINGQVVAEDRDVISDDDPCVKCRCSNKRLTCMKKACPVLQCSIDKQFKLPGECCPRCKGTRSIIMVEHACPIQTSFFWDGQSWKLDKCTECSCINSTSVCTRVSCPILDCAPELQKSFPGHCCPICTKPRVEEMITHCELDGRVYEDGNVYQLDVCSSCKCHNGKFSCARTKCNTCAPNMKMLRIPGECCAKCVENDGACMAFGDPHYKTFDGMIYTFKGIGKYQLIEDVYNKSFSIKVANYEYVAHNSKASTITKRVAVNFGKIRLNLQQRLRVKYNGNKAAIPLVEPGYFNLTRKGDLLEVRLQNDVTITWNGRSFLEVTVPPVFKGKLRGLCGNFNGDVQDDFQTKTGKIVGDKDLLSFGSSWCVGKKSECAKKIKPEKQKGGRDPTECKYLFNESFSECESKLSNSKYFKACRMDMHSCAHKKCYCESIMAYARECERLGVKLPNWQKHSNCLTLKERKNKRIEQRPSHHRTKPHKSLDMLRYSHVSKPSWNQLLNVSQISQRSRILNPLPIQ